ncbi:unnamed protein product, partial [Soboliphyme baturini]|uniref:PHD-type domain-containing protein n=1 Tax=Soboliphyme baturini TaxID=241478 RepID=A0A183IDH0_9BILA
DFVSACYGIVSVPTGPWFCERCVATHGNGYKRAATNGSDGDYNQHVGGKQEQQQLQTDDDLDNLSCKLCPYKDGAFKRTDTGAWAHVVCALYIPEVKFGNVTTMDPIILAHIPPERYNKTCFICEEQGRMEDAKSGACMQCNKPGCKNYFHVTCGQKERLLFEEPGQLDNIKYCGYCPHHFKKLVSGDRKDNLTSSSSSLAHNSASVPPKCENSNSRLYTELRNMFDSDNAVDKVTTRMRKSSAGVGDKTDLAANSSTATLDSQSPAGGGYVAAFHSYSPSLPSHVYLVSGCGQGNTVSHPYKVSSSYSLLQPSTTCSGSCYVGPSSSASSSALSSNSTNFYPAVCSSSAAVNSFSAIGDPSAMACVSFAPSHMPLDAAVHASSSSLLSSTCVPPTTTNPCCPSSDVTTSPNVVTITGVAGAGVQQLPLVHGKRAAPLRIVKTEILSPPKKGKRPNKKTASRKSSFDASTTPVAAISYDDPSTKTDGGVSNGDPSNRPCCSASLAATETPLTKLPGVSSVKNRADGNGIFGFSTAPASVSSVHCSKREVKTSAASSETFVGPGPHGTGVLSLSFEQLLERHWEQVASLLTCLHQLKSENKKYEEHIASLVTRRDHLLAVNARLSLPLSSHQNSSSVAPHMSVSFPTYQQGDQMVGGEQFRTNIINRYCSDRFDDPSLVPTSIPPMSGHGVGGGGRPTASSTVFPPQNIASSRPYLVPASNPAVPQDGSGAGRGAFTAASTATASTAITATTSPVIVPSATTAAPLVNGLSGFANVRPKNISPDKQSSFLIPRTPTPLMSNTDLVKPAAANILSSQFSVANQDVHHSQVLYQLMAQQQAVAAVYGNAFPSFMPTTSPHISNTTSMMPPNQSMLHAPYSSHTKNQSLNP